MTDTHATTRQRSNSNDIEPARAVPTTWRRRKSRGQSLVEFALITPLLILILAVAADFGRAFTAYITIGSAAREGAAYGSASLISSTNTSGISSAALGDAQTIWGVSPSVTSTTGTDQWGYRYVQVRVAYTFSSIMTVPGVPDPVNMQRTVRMRVVN